VSTCQDQTKWKTKQLDARDKVGRTVKIRRFFPPTAEREMKLFGQSLLKSERKVESCRVEKLESKPEERTCSVFLDF
jgi:hypothetical protein